MIRAILRLFRPARYKAYGYYETRWRTHPPWQPGRF